MCLTLYKKRAAAGTHGCKHMDTLTVSDGEVWDKETQTSRAFRHTYQQHLGLGSNKRDKSREKPCKADPNLSFSSFLFFAT